MLPRSARVRPSPTSSMRDAPPRSAAAHACARSRADGTTNSAGARSTSGAGGSRSRENGPGAGRDNSSTEPAPLLLRLAAGDPLLDDRREQLVVQRGARTESGVAVRSGGRGDDRMGVDFQMRGPGVEVADHGRYLRQQPIAAGPHVSADGARRAPTDHQRRRPVRGPGRPDEASGCSASASEAVEPGGRVAALRGGTSRACRPCRRTAGCRTSGCASVVPFVRSSTAIVADGTSPARS